MRTKTPERKEIAVAISDTHFSPEAPRAIYSDRWGRQQMGVMAAVSELANKYNVPCIIAGDIFDRWNSSAETINSVMRWLKKFQHGILAIPGQHDLPYHAHDAMLKSAYYTLAQAKVIHDLTDKCYNGTETNKIQVYGYEWTSQHGAEAIDKLWDVDGTGNIAVLHAFCYENFGKAPFNVPEDCHHAAYAKMFKEFDFVIIGDHHSPFVVRNENGPTVVNCGGTIGRTKSEKGKPKYAYVLFDDKSVEQVELPQPQWKSDEELENYVEVDTNEVKLVLKEAADFVQTVKQGVQTVYELIMNAVVNHPEEIKTLMRELIGDVKNADRG